MPNALSLLTLIALSAAIRAEAGTFTPVEVEKHKANVGTIVKVSAKCLDDKYAVHLAFYKKYGVSKFYGNRRKDYRTDAQRREVLRSYGYSWAQVDEIAPQLRGTACITMAMECLEKGFVAADMKGTWAKINAKLAIDDKFYGTDLQVMLQELGWRIYFWNPDPSSNERWDEEDRYLNPLTDEMIARGQDWNPVWGGHATRYNSVMRNGTYYRTRVDDRQALVGFSTRPPAAFRNVPFFLGIAHAGYHVFPGRYGEVIEAHSMRELNSRDNLEFSAFNPLAPGGGPKWTRSEKYRSGLIAVPPGY